MNRLMIGDLDALHYCAVTESVYTGDLVRRLRISHNSAANLQRRLGNAGLLIRKPHGTAYTYHTTATGIQLLQNYATMLSKYSLVVGE